MRDTLWGIMGAVCFMGLGFFGHMIVDRTPQPAQASVTDERELVARGMTILNVQAGAKIILYPGGDFVINAPDGGVTVVQMPQPKSSPQRR